MVMFGDPGMSVVARGAVVLPLVLFSTSSTALLHWCIKPYINSMTKLNNDTQLLITRLNLFGRPYDTRINVEDCTWKAGRPMATFRCTATDDAFFAHEHMIDRDPVMHRILPRLQRETEQKDAKKADEADVKADGTKKPAAAQQEEKEKKKSRLAPKKKEATGPPSSAREAARAKRRQKRGRR
jgi:hypothetical protein